MSEVESRPAEGRLIERVVVGVFGHAQHGKDTTAALLAAELHQRGKRVRTFALADPLKHVAVHLLGMPAEIAWGGMDIAERERQRLAWVLYGKNARQWLQWIGTELGRQQIDENLWVDRAVGTVTDDDEGTEYFIITDCRFHNERDGLRTKLAQRFARFSPVRVYRPGVQVDTSHPSEAELATMTEQMFDYVIDNDSDLATLRRRVIEYMETCLGV